VLVLDHQCIRQRAMGYQMVYRLLRTWLQNKTGINLIRIDGSFHG
jgi:hypothetical protein